MHINKNGHHEEHEVLFLCALGNRSCIALPPASTQSFVSSW